MEQRIAEMIKDRIGKDVTVEFKEVEKNNGQIRKAVIIRTKGSNVAPTIYYDDKLSDEEIEEFAVNAYVESIEDQPEFNIDEIMTAEYVKSHVRPVIVNAEKNADALSEMVSNKFVGDLAIIYKVEIDTNSTAGFGNMTLRVKHLDAIGMTTDEVHESAIANVQGKGQLMNLSDMLGEMIPELPLMVLTNESKVFGAAMILDESVVDTIEELGDVYVIPSSVHELLIVPMDADNEMCNPDELVNLIRSVNESTVSPEDFLSDHLYKFTENGLEMMEV